MVALLAPPMCFSQLTIEHLYETTKTFSPWFGKEKGQLSFFLELSYRDGGDSTMNLVMSINQSKMQLSGTTNTMALGGSSGLLGSLAAGLANSRTYTLSNSQGIVVFDDHSYDSLLLVLNKIKTISEIGISFPKSVFYRVNKIVIGLDMKISVNEQGRRFIDKTYYFQIDDASFKLSESEYKDLCNDSLYPLKESFEMFNKNRTIQIPAKK